MNKTLPYLTNIRFDSTIAIQTYQLILLLRLRALVLGFF